MATFRVRCPTCNAELELDDAHAGKEVECGSCLQVFTAPDRAEKQKPYRMRPDRDDDAEEERPSRRRRPRRDDDYDEYDYSPPSAGGGGGGSTVAVISLVLGIVSFPMMCCCSFISIPLSIGGIVCGLIGMQKPEGKGMAVAGLILSGLSLVLTGGLLFLGFGLNLMNNPGGFRLGR
jgi:predicted Zn finger-like uncharacterized protein